MDMAVGMDDMAHMGPMAMACLEHMVQFRPLGTHSAQQLPLQLSLRLPQHQQQQQHSKSWRAWLLQWTNPFPLSSRPMAAPSPFPPSFPLPAQDCSLHQAHPHWLCRFPPWLLAQQLAMLQLIPTLQPQVPCQLPLQLLASTPNSPSHLLQRQVLEQWVRSPPTPLWMGCQTENFQEP